MSAGPYIVTVKTPSTVLRPPNSEEWASASRRAVATLDEAQGYVWELVFSHDPAFDFTWRDKADALPKSGGTVGPLPDGTVIEVEAATALDLWEAAGRPSLPALDGPYGSFNRVAYRAQIIAAYNRSQGDA